MLAAYRAVYCAMCFKTASTAFGYNDQLVYDWEKQLPKMCMPQSASKSRVLLVTPNAPSSASSCFASPSSFSFLIFLLPILLAFVPSSTFVAHCCKISSYG